MYPQMLEIEFYFVPNECAGAICKYQLLTRGANQKYACAMVDYFMGKFSKLNYHRNIGLFEVRNQANKAINYQIMQAINVIPPNYSLFYKVKFNEQDVWEQVFVDMFLREYKKRIAELEIFQNLAIAYELRKPLTQP